MTAFKTLSRICFLGLGLSTAVALQAADKGNPQKADAPKQVEAFGLKFPFASHLEGAFNAQVNALQTKKEAPNVFPAANCVVADAVNNFRTLVTNLALPAYDGNSPWRVDPALYVSTLRNTFIDIKFRPNPANRSEVNHASVEFRSLCDLTRHNDLNLSSKYASGADFIGEKESKSNYLELKLRNTIGEDAPRLNANHPVARFVGFPGPDGRTLMIYVVILDRTDRDHPENLQVIDQFFAVKP